MKQYDIEMIRHSFAHVLMQALHRLYKDAIPASGPAIEYGFYHDFDASHKVTDEDLRDIEKEMKRIIGQGLSIEKNTKSMQEAKSWLSEHGYKYGLEFLDDVNEGGGKEVTFFSQGEFTNMCKGPHVSNTKDLNPKAFRLMRVSGAYFKGDEKNPMLQRIYGVAFHTKEELQAHLFMIEEAKKRDHKKLGKELDLFVFSDLVGSGLPLWTPKGNVLRTVLDEYVWELRKEKGYERVEIPHITKKDLYERSGHWEKFKDELFKITTREGHEFALKPMNCPHHTQIYASKSRSYRELPVRYANTTMCYRDEQSGELSGLSRVRAFTQDDAHVFCRHSQIQEEFLKIWDIIDRFYVTVGFRDLTVRLSLHDPDQFEKYLGQEDQWEKAEDALRSICKIRNVTPIEKKGEAAFYGPKVDFIGKDSLGREWQVATIQLDMNLPERFDLFCINEEGKQERIVMIHAAIMGSIERFLSIIIEHYAGAFPVWMAPIQASVITVGEKHMAYAKEIERIYSQKGLRVAVDDANETVGNKIRKSIAQKIPYVLVVGDKEVENNTVSVRKRDEKDMIGMTVDAFADTLKEEISKK